MNKVRIGIIGIGNIGSAHALNIFNGKIKGLELTALCDIDPNRFKWAKNTFGMQIPLYSDYRLLLKSGLVDAILIATPHSLHPFIAMDGFRANLHVLTEKPAGIDTFHVRQMNKAAKESGKIYAIMYNQRTNPLFARLKSMVEEGKLGEIKRFTWIVSNWYRTQAYYNSGTWRGSWSGEGGGVLMNQCPHNLDIWQWITGMPDKIRAFCKYGHYHNITVEDDVTIVAEYANKATAVFITSTGEYPGTNRMEYIGTKGKVIIEEGILKFYSLESDEREIRFTTDAASPNIDVYYEEFKQTEPESGHIGILQNFTDAILYNKDLLAPGYEGINGLTISNAAYMSDWLDSWIDLPLDEELYRRLLKEKQEKEVTIKKQAFKENLNGKYNERWQVRW
ncbi:Gfo/Idh/MocA family protein [Herbinix luporum]|uniref:Gfo/Idh/MocA family protein n=1 Tax=Herbinix luporum TaxID=1679721 RepID=UPI0023F43718|nr:Gfo/Idh/MocA family oxidoreductase [Herbinix luporum]